MITIVTGLGPFIKYVGMEGEGSLGRCVRIVYKEMGLGCCVRTHFFKYSSKIFTFNKLYIIFEYRHIAINLSSLGERTWGRGHELA